MKRGIMITGLCAGMAVMAIGTQAADKPRPSFKALDTNEDGKLTLKEFKQMPVRGRGTPDAMFKMKDTDKDGFLSETEFNTRSGSRGGGRRGR
jgi:Ca2+-binding EF-hand superfamily protein